MSEELTLRVKVGEEWRSLPESTFLRELAWHRQRGFEGVPRVPVTIEAIDEQGRVWWRGFYRDLEFAACELLDNAANSQR